MRFFFRADKYQLLKRNIKIEMRVTMFLVLNTSKYNNYIWEIGIFIEIFVPALILLFKLS